MSRRQFVAGTAAVAAVAALDACAPRVPSTGGVTPRPDDSTSPVLIIGAGIAGLTAGYRLRQAGVPVRIIEAQNRIGGRMFSLRNFFADGQVCELGGELIDTNQTHIQALAGELGIPLDDLSKDDALVRDMFYFDGALRSEREVVAAFAISLPKSGRWMEAVKSGGGVLLLLAALYFLTPIVPALRCRRSFSIC